MKTLPMLAGAALAAAIAAATLTVPAVATQTTPTAVEPVGDVVVERPAVAHDTSPPLRALAARASVADDTSAPVLTERPVSIQKPTPGIRLNAMINSNPALPSFPDPTGPAPGTAMPAPSFGFAGMKALDQPNLSYRYYPPDTDGDIGPNHYVQMVNAMIAVFDKQTGVPLLGPIDNNTIWGGFGGDCAVTNDGDPIVKYDQFADRWLVSQFSVSGSQLLECVAISATPDPAGAYHRYAFAYDEFPDYPKFGIWPDGYYVTYNMYNPITFDFLSATTCALERKAMLVGAAASQQCTVAPQEYALLPADADGTEPPPAGSPAYVLGESWDDNEKLTMYKFHVDWDTPANSTWTGPISLDVDPFTWACVDVSRGRCVPQADTDVLLEVLGARLMNRLAYRNFGTHESLVANHTVAMDGQLGLTAQTGLNWFEVRDLQQATPTVYQDGTSADPDNTTFRWMASMAMDKVGNMALGYSKSSSTQYPSIAYTGRLAGDPLNQMTQAEATVVAGTGSQTGSSARWGDYSSMQVDPVDDCTFWYTNEFLSTTSAKDWETWVTSFKYNECSGSSTTPGAPGAAAAARGDRKVRVSWGAAANGGMPVVGYTVTASPGGASCSTMVGVQANPLTCAVEGLTNGVAYTFDVRATNALGDGPGVSASGTPATVPSAPISPTAAAGSRTATIAWQRPVSNGGSAITRYTVTANPGGRTCTAAGGSPPATSCAVTGLTNGTPYTFTVRAANAVGSGPASPTTVPVTPTAPRVLSISVASPVKPGAKVPVAIAGAGSGCTVRVSLNSVRRRTVATSTGSGSVVIPAPQPNATYPVAARQSGAGCAPQTASAVVTVAGGYITGPTSAKVNKKVTFKAHAFPAGKTVTWTAKRKGKTVAKQKVTASGKGVAKFSVRLPRRGTYTITAARKSNKARFSVRVRGAAATDALG